MKNRSRKSFSSIYVCCDSNGNFKKKQEVKLEEECEKRENNNKNQKKIFQISELGGIMGVLLWFV